LPKASEDDFVVGLAERTSRCPPLPPPPLMVADWLFIMQDGMSIAAKAATVI
jgi:hypothetical protein